MTTAFRPTLPPVARGACRAVSASVPLPESPPAPPADAPVEAVLADQAGALAATVEEATPEALRAARAAARARAIDEAIAAADQSLARPRTLTRWGYGAEPAWNDLHERAHVAGLRAAQSSGGAARLHPYLNDVYRTEELRERYEALLAEEAGWRARQERERHPGRA